MDLNKAMIIGNITRDPEVRTTPAGQTVANFSVATNLVWTDQSGMKQSRAEFHNVVAWRKLAEICGQYLNKGKKVYIEGRLQTRDWEDQSGVKRYRTEIVVDNMIMLDRGGAQGSGGFGGNGAPTRSTPEEPVSQPVPSGNVSDDEIRVEDIPF